MTRCHVREQADRAPGAAAGSRTGFRLQAHCSSFGVMLGNTVRRIYTMRPTRLLPVLALLLTATVAGAQEKRPIEVEYQFLMRSVGPPVVSQGHGIRVLSHEVDRYEGYLAWYDEWVKESTNPVTEHQSH